MGYCIYMEDSNLKISEDNMKLLLADLGKFFDAGGEFDWVDGFSYKEVMAYEMETEADINDFWEDLRYGWDYKDGYYYLSDFYGEKYGSELDLFKMVAKYSENGFIEFRGEDGEWFKILIKNGEAKEVNADISYPDIEIEPSLPKENNLFKIEDMPKVGVYFGKFIPPHRGHLTAIVNAATKCQKLYVVVSDNRNRTERICKESGIKNISIELRLQWLSQELQDLNHIKVVALDETDLPEYPNGWEEWTSKMKEVIKEPIDIFYCGELEYRDELKKYFPNSQVEVFDPERQTYNISATIIRSNPYKYWDHILGPARPFFAKKVLIAGTESCGKTTMVKYLAKMYNTSWSEEVGRYYAEKFLGGNETIFTDEDFSRIAHQQIEQDYAALRTCNRICFFDTDATITQYYSELYMGHANEQVQACINPEKFDIVIMLKPDVEWINDRQRLNSDQQRREDLHNRLKDMYIKNGFKNIVEVSGNYNERLNKITSIINELLSK